MHRCVRVCVCVCVLKLMNECSLQACDEATGSPLKRPLVSRAAGSPRGLKGSKTAETASPTKEEGDAPNLYLKPPRRR